MQVRKERSETGDEPSWHSVDWTHARKSRGGRAKKVGPVVNFASIEIFSGYSSSADLSR